MTADQTADGATPWLRELAALPAAERAGHLEALVMREFRIALLLGDDEVLPYDESYFAHGLTSLGAVEIEQRLEATIGRSIDAADLLNNPTVNGLLAYLRTRLADLFGEEPTADVPTVQQDGGGVRVPRAMVDDLLGELYAG